MQWLTTEKYGNGSDGDLSISADATWGAAHGYYVASCTGTATQTELTATNANFATNQIILIHQSRGTGVGQWELNVISGYTAGTITTKYALAYTYTDSGASQAQVQTVPQFSSATVDSTKTLTAPGWGGDTGGIIAFMCSGLTTITGNIVGNGKGYRGGTRPTNANGYQGEGTVGAGLQDVRTANGSGGGGTDQKTAGGGGGGHGAAGDPGDTDASGYGNGGLESGSADLVTADFGGGGGSGGGDAANGGTGAPAGGLIAIFTNKLAEITGGINSNGNNGENGEGTDSGGGGGGAGGPVLIKCNTAVLGTNKITATGGTGGNGQGGTRGGGDASVGRVAVYYGTSYSGESSPAATFTLDTDLIPFTGGGSFLFNFV